MRTLYRSYVLTATLSSAIDISPGQTRRSRFAPSVSTLLPLAMV